MSLPIYVISLPSSHTRRQRFCHRAASVHLQFSFFDAQYGESSPLCQEIFVQQSHKQKFKRLLSLPEIGCYVSHINLWKKISHMENPGAIILEDDADFSPGFTQLISHLEKCDIRNILIKFDSLRKNPQKKYYLCDVPGGFSILQPRTLSARTTGYLIGKKAALDLLIARQNIYRPIDMDMKHWWEHSIPSLVTEPGAVYEAANTDDSSIEESRLQKKDSHFLKRFYRNMYYQLNMRHQSWKNPLPYVSPSIFLNP
ncbi:MAG: glycosyl transferase [Candidatus Liberibacter ctenarytainae]|uniref:Glycosyl transferase n=1 Tax=Candidatus Liberibacter ctenarytainae TaxID=2020335 RepID=A0A937AKF0_9HYPH|nr:glycosyl transferase [Candidatus Liberibacter ctenarytainae]